MNDRTRSAEGQGVDPRGPRRATRVRLAFAAVWIGTVAVLLSQLPFTSDSLMALERVARLSSLGEVFEFAPIYRPLEVAWFFALERTGLDQPWIGRLLPVSKHLGVCALLYVLARELGASREAAASGVLLFAVAPTTKVLGWVMAHSTQGRTLWVLVGLVAFLRHRRQPRAGLVAVMAVAMVLGLLQHPSTIELPLICAAWVALTRGEGRGSRTALGTLIGLAAAYVLFTLFVLPDRYHGLGKLEALPANGAKALTCVLPEDLRLAVLEGLRGARGTLGFVGAGAVVALLLAALSAALWRGPAAARLIVVAMIVDLAIPGLTTGIVQRHAYFPLAFLSVGFALAIHARPRSAGAAALVLGSAWLFDSTVDLTEQLEAGRIVDQVVQQCHDLRVELGEEPTVVVVDLPCGWGRESDVPVFNWGFAQALRRAGVRGHFVAWRTTAPGTSTSQVLVAPGELDERLERMGAVVRHFDPDVRRLVSRP